MAYGALVADELTPQLIESGKALVTALDTANVPVTAAFWRFSEESHGWRLVIASPEVSEFGPYSFYLKLGTFLKSPELADLNLSLLTAAAHNDRLVTLLRAGVHTGPGLSAIRLTRDVIKGVLIPDVLIYRVQ